MKNRVPIEVIIVHTPIRKEVIEVKPVRELELYTLKLEQILEDMREELEEWKSEFHRVDNEKDDLLLELRNLS